MGVAPNKCNRVTCLSGIVRLLTKTMLAIVNDVKGFDFIASVAGMIRNNWRYVGDG